MNFSVQENGKTTSPVLSENSSNSSWPGLKDIFREILSGKLFRNWGPASSTTAQVHSLYQNDPVWLYGTFITSPPDEIVVRSSTDVALCHPQYMYWRQWRRNSEFRGGYFPKQLKKQLKKQTNTYCRYYSWKPLTQ